MTIRLPHWLARLFGRFKPVQPWPDTITPGKTIEVMPTARESELQALRNRCNQLERELEIVRKGSRSMDLLAIRMADNVKAMQIKYQLVKKNYVALKINCSQMLTFMRQEPLLKLLPEKTAGNIRFLAQHMEQDSGAVDPEVMTPWGLKAISEGKFKLREMQPLLAICPDFDAEQEKIAYEVEQQIAESKKLAHNPETSTTEQQHHAARQDPGVHGIQHRRTFLDGPESDRHPQGSQGLAKTGHATQAGESIEIQAKGPQGSRPGRR